MNKKILAGLVTGIFLSGSFSTAQATLIQNDFGLSSTHSTITFDEHVFPSGTGLTTQYSDLGVAFSPFAYYSPYGSADISNFMPYVYAYPFSMSFLSQQAEVAFNLVTAYPATTTFQAFLGGSLVEEGTVTTGAHSNDYYGFTGISFDQIAIYTSYENGVKNASWTGPLIIDNLQVNNPITPSITIDGGTIAPGSAGSADPIGEVKIDGDLTLKHGVEYVVDLDLAGLKSDYLGVDGTLNLGTDSLLDLNLIHDLLLDAGKEFQIVGFGGSDGNYFKGFADGYRFNRGQNRWEIDYRPGGIYLTSLGAAAVPEPSSLALLLLAAGLLGVRRRSQVSGNSVW